MSPRVRSPGRRFLSGSAGELSGGFLPDGEQEQHHSPAGQDQDSHQDHDPPGECSGRLRGLRAASILNNVVLWGNDTADAIGGYASGEDMTAVGEKREIAVALEALYRLSKEEKA